MQDDCVELQVITKLPWPLRLIRVDVESVAMRCKPHSTSLLWNNKYPHFADVSPAQLPTISVSSNLAPASPTF
jgi:hypothetical protein